MRKLVKLGVVEASWSGTGAGGRSEFGIGRARDYWLKPEYQLRQFGGQLESVKLAESLGIGE